MKKLIIALTIVIASPLWGDGRGVAQANEPGSGNCLEFDGVNDYVSLIAVDDELKGLSQLTVSAWVKLSAGGSTNIVMIQHQYTRGLYIALSPSGWITVGIKTIATNSQWTNASGTSGIPINDWVFVTLRWDGALLKGYINGIEICSNSVGSSFGTGNMTSPDWQLRIGRHYWGTATDDFFSGSVDEVRIWDHARSQTQIRENMCKKLTGSEPGLVGYWRFDEGSGTIAVDSSPNNNDGTLQ